MEVLFLRPFKTTKEQLRILHDRGIVFTDYQNYRKAKRYLLANNYYTVINGYGRYFWTNTNSYPLTKFDEITALYEFDIAIRDAFFKSTLIVEKHLRGVVSYYVSQKCSEVGEIEAYMKKNFYDRDILFVRKKMWEIIDKNVNKRSNNPIKNHSLNHGGVPFWVIVNYLSFRDLFEILKNITHIQNDVARSFYTFIEDHFQVNQNFTPADLLSFVYNIYEVRNHCAHGNRLIGFTCHESTRHYSPLHNIYNIIPNSPRQDVYNVYLVLQCFNSKIEYAILHNTLLKRMKYLKNKIDSSTFNKIMDELGFPRNWVNTTTSIHQ